MVVKGTWRTKAEEQWKTPPAKDGQRSYMPSVRGNMPEEFVFLCFYVFLSLKEPIWVSDLQHSVCWMLSLIQVKHEKDPRHPWVSYVVVLTVSYCHIEWNTPHWTVVTMFKCHRYQKHCAITPVIAFQHSWQVKLNSSWVSSFSIWLWSHFHAGHSCTKTACVHHYKDIWFSMKKNLNYVVFFLLPLLPSKKNAGKSHENKQWLSSGFHCQNLQPQSYRSSRGSGVLEYVMKREEKWRRRHILELYW